MALNKSDFSLLIDAPRERVWDVLFNQYGDIHIHNPTMQASHYMNGATQGELGCLRHCDFTDKLWLQEKIAKFDELNSVTVEATDHNLPFLTKMSAIYELAAKGGGKTELRMTSFNATRPAFMIYLMRGQLGKSLKKHLFGMKYFIETGETLDMADYDRVHKSYGRSDVHVPPSVPRKAVS